MMYRHGAGFAGSLALILGLLGCGGDEPAPGNGPSTTSQALCKRDEALLAERHDCTRDDDCPCGSACELGTCGTGCKADTECGAGFVCDGYGRCTTPETANAPVPPTVQPPRNDISQAASDGGTPVSPAPGAIRIDRNAIDLRTPDAVATFHVSAAQGAVQKVRLQAASGLQIDCGAGLATECFVGPLTAEAAPQEIQVRSAGTFPTTDVRFGIGVFAGGASTEVGVFKRGAPPSALAPREGFYEGTASLAGAGMRSRTTLDTLPPELARLKLTVKAKVFPTGGGQYLVSFEDARGAVFPAKAVGTLSVEAGAETWKLDVPSQQFLGDDVDQPAAGAVDVHASEKMSGVTFKEGLLLGDVVSTFEGITTGAYAPFARWRLSLTRTADLPAGEVAPAIAARPVADVTARANQPLAEETAALQHIDGSSQLLGAELPVAAWCSPDAGRVIAFGSAQDARGDLKCQNGTSQLAYSTTLGTLLERGSYLDDCMRAFDPQNLEWGDASPTAPCANRVRAISAMAFSLATDRARALGTAGAPNLAQSRLAARSLQLWLGAESILGSDPTRIATLGPLLPGGTDIDKLRYYASYDNAFDALRRSIGGWDVLLNPRIGVALAAMSPDALESPDYRPSFSAGTFSGGEQSVGLPVNVLATLTSQLQGVSGLVDALANQRITGQAAQTYAVEVARFMPRAVVLFAVAQGLRDAARSNGSEPWEATWLAARAKYGSALAKLSTDLKALESNENPLGLEDTDLPLYRLGEQVGPNARFSAVADSLIGRDDELDPAIASVLVSRALDAEDAARASLGSVLARDYETELQASATQRNLQSLKRYYGEQVTSLCGLSYLNSLGVLDNADQIDGDTCYVLPSCLPTPEAQAARESKIDRGHLVCMMSQLRHFLGDAITSGHAPLDTAVDGMFSSFVAGAPLPATDALAPLFQAASNAKNGAETAQLPANVDSAKVIAARDLCDSAREASESARPKRAPASCTTTDDCPTAMLCNAGRCAEPQALPPTCYQGSLGQQLLAVQSAATDLETARQEYLDYARTYDIAMQSCKLQKATADQVAGLNDSFNKVSSDLAYAKSACDIVEKAVGTAREVAGTAASGGIFGGISAAVGATLGVVETAAFAASSILGVQMENLERSHASAVDGLDRQTAVAICLNEAGGQLIGQRAATLRITRASQELAAQMYAFHQMQGGVEEALGEGLASVAYEQARQVLPSNADFWLDQNVDVFQSNLRRARRAVYLGILGVEYELQQTSAERSNVLAAQSAEQLDAILGRVRDGVRRGAPAGGGNPTELRSVLSLRENILQLDNRADASPGWQPLTKIQRLQRVLVSKKFEVYDANGMYVGQEIPFSLAPIGNSGLGDPAGIPLFSGLSCAERLWSVNAVILGQNLMVGTDTSLTSIQLRKRNTFQSQWCSGAARTPLQIASTRPGANLFIDPLSASSWTNDATLASLTGTSATNAFSYATIEARLGVDRKTLESNAYEDGASTALAGRGAFGEYTLFIPRTSQTVTGSAGLDLSRVEDILIRLDYVAAERQ